MGSGSSVQESLALRAEAGCSSDLGRWLFQGATGKWRGTQREQRIYIVRGESNLGNRVVQSRWWLKKQTVGRLCRNAGACCRLESGTKSCTGIRCASKRLLYFWSTTTGFAPEMRPSSVRTFVANGNCQSRSVYGHGHGQSSLGRNTLIIY